MVNKCDICGFHYGPNDRYCGGCNVDLQEQKGIENSNTSARTLKQDNTKAKTSPKKKESEDDSIIKWCGIRALCNSFEMSYPLFSNLVLILAGGEKKLGFCDCSSCNLGYREMLAMVANITENKKLTAQSREIVIQARSEKINGFAIDFSELLRRIYEKKGKEQPIYNQEFVPKQRSNGKIVIELDPLVIENAVFSVLKSEKGQEIIRSIPKKKSKRLES